MVADPTTGSTLKLASLSNADFALYKANFKSLTGVVVLIINMPVSYTGMTQGDVSLSEMETQSVETSDAARELLNICRLVQDLSLAFVNPMLMIIDNQYTIKNLENSLSPAKANHIDKRVDFVCDISTGVICHTRNPPFCQCDWL